MLDYIALSEQCKDLSILIIEDYEPLRRITSSTLEDYFADVLTANDGDEGMEKYHAYLRDNDRPVDIILTDVNMPKKNGLQLSKEIMSANPEQIIIVISANRDHDNMVGFINIGVTRFVSKPIDMTELMQLLDEISKKLTLSAS